MLLLVKLSDRSAVLTVVLAAHLALWWAWPAVRQTAPAPAAQPTLRVRLLTLPPFDPLPPDQRPPAAHRVDVPQARPPPATEAPVVSFVLPPPVSASAASAAAPAPLNLALPRALMADPGIRQQALDDPRANPVHKTLESHIAAANPSDALVIEDLGGGRRRMRKGNDCVEVHDARIAGIEPFNQSVSPSMKGAMTCR
jgi:hypothetical protein